MMLSHIIAIILALILFLIPQLKFPNLDKQQKKLLLLVTVGMVWTISEFIPNYFYFKHDTLLTLHKLSFSLSVTMFGSLLFLVYDLLEFKWNKFINYMVTVYYATIILLTAFTNFFITNINLGTDGLYNNTPGIGYYPTLILIFVTTVFLNIVYIKELIKKELDQRMQNIVKILLYSTSIPPLLGMTYNLLLPVLGYEVQSIAHMSYAITALGFIYVIYKYNAFNIIHTDIPIWTKIYFIINSLSFIIIFSSFFTYYQVASSNIESSVLNNLHIIANSEKEEIDTYLGKLIKSVEFAPTNKWINEGIEESDSSNQFFNILYSRLHTNWDIYDLLVIDREGNVFWSGKEENDLHTNIYNSKYSNSYLTSAVDSSLKNGLYKLSDYSHYTPSNQEISFLSIPVIKDGKVIGTLVVKLGNTYFNQFLVRHSEQPLVYLIQENHKTIYPTNTQVYTQTKASEGCYNNQTTNSHQLSSYLYSLETDEKVLAESTLLDSTNWCLIIEENETIAMQSINDFLFTFTYFSITISIIIAVSGHYLSKRITAPISKLSSSLSNLSLTSTTKQLSVNRNDEVGQLATVFNKMISNLKDSQITIMKQVRDQTSEISTTKSKLEQQQSAIINILQDIEEEKEEAANQRDRLNIILKSIGDGVFVVDKNQNILLMNKQASIISGYTPEEVLNKPYKKFLKFVNESTQEPVVDFIIDAMKRRKTLSMPKRTVLITKQGNQIPVADSAAPLKNEAGEIMGCVVVFRDITKEKELDEMKTEFLSVAAHQLRTPLGSMRWNIEMLISGDIEEVSEPIKDILQQVYDSNQRMAILVDDLLNTSRIDQERIADKPIETDIISIIKDAITEIDPFAQKRSITVSLDIEGDGYKEVILDPKKFREVIQNLLSNSVKYNKDGGKIFISVKKNTTFTNTNGRKLPCGYLIKVQDTGMGIPKRDQKKLFSKFFRADNAVQSETEGSGLGLFVVKSYVEDWGGSVGFESEEGKGTTFKICLPNKPDESKLNFNLKDKPHIV